MDPFPSPSYAAEWAACLQRRSSLIQNNPSDKRADEEPDQKENSTDPSEPPGALRFGQRQFARQCAFSLNTPTYARLCDCGDPGGSWKFRGLFPQGLGANRDRQMPEEGVVGCRTSYGT